MNEHVKGVVPGPRLKRCLVCGVARDRDTLSLKRLLQMGRGKEGRIPDGNTIFLWGCLEGHATRHDDEVVPSAPRDEDDGLLIRLDG